jgi:methylenetetrahydrofolate reductase (NADPH)
VTFADDLGKKFVVTAEIGMPDHNGIEKALGEAKTVQSHVDAMGAADSPRGHVKVSAMAMSKLLLDHGIEPIMHVACSNRNRVALLSDVMGAYGLGVRNFLAVTGDHPIHGDRPGARPVFDIDSLGLLEEMKDLPGICRGGVVNPYGVPEDLIVERLHAKVDAGARFIMTQPVFDLEGFGDFMGRFGRLEAVLIPSIMVISSPKQAEFVKTRVPGVHLPDHVYQRIKGSNQPDKVGLKIAQEVLEALRDMKGVGGVNLMSLGSLEKLADILDQP